MNFKHILFPVDFSECSRALNPEVEYLAKRFGSEVTLLNVFEIPFTWYCGEGSMMHTDCLKACIEAEKQRLAEYRIDIPAGRLHRLVVEGEAAFQIKEQVVNSNVDLVVIGTHGYGIFRRMLLGSTAMKVLHDVTCPVWTHCVANRAARPFASTRDILCALEMDEEAVPLLRFLKQLAKDFDASVRIAHSVPAQTAQPLPHFDAALHRLLPKNADEQIFDLQTKAGTNFSVDLVDNPIAEGTALLGAQQQAALVVVGRGRTRDVFGTTRTHVYDIIRESSCPVLSYCFLTEENNVRR